MKDRLDAAFAAWEPEAPTNEASAPSGWPVEQADLFVLDPESPLALCTLADLDLARSLAALGHPQLAVVGPMATENLGVEKLIRNVLTSPAIGTILLVGPEASGSAPTGHYAGDALLCLLENGVDPKTMRIKEARGRRPILKNLTPAEVEAFRRRTTLVDQRGLTDSGAIREALDTAASEAAARGPVEGGVPAGGASPRLVPLVGAAASASGFQKDPNGYFLIYVDHLKARLVVEHYTIADERTLMIVGEEPKAIAGLAIERGLLGTLDHAVYLGRELERAGRALRTGHAYVQDEGSGG